MSDQQGWVAPGTGGTPSGNPDPRTDRHEAFPPVDVTQPVSYGPPVPPTAPVPVATPVAAPGYPSAAAPMPPPYLQMEYRPGIIPLRPLTMSEMWSGVMTAVRGNPAATIALALVTALVVLTPLTLLGAWLVSDLSAGIDSAEAAGLKLLLVAAVSLISLLGMSIVLPVFMAFVIGQGVQGRKVGIGQTWAGTRGRVLPAFGLALLVVLGSALWVVLIALLFQASEGFAVLAVLASVPVWILLWTRTSFAMSIVCLESAGPLRALSRSWQLTRGAFWRTFGIRLLTAFIGGIVGYMVAFPVQLVAMLFGAPDPYADPAEMTDSFTMAYLIGQSFSTLIQAVLITPFTSGVDSMLYVDARIRREGLDVQIMQQARAAGSA